MGGGRLEGSSRSRLRNDLGILFLAEWSITASSSIKTLYSCALSKICDFATSRLDNPSLNHERVVLYVIKSSYMVVKLKIVLGVPLRHKSDIIH